MTQSPGAAPAPTTGSGAVARVRRIGGAVLVVAAFVVGLFFVGMWQTLNLCACSGPSNPPPPPSSPVVGVVVGVDTQGLGRVRGFTLRAGAATYSMAIGPLENETEFTPSHLSEHMATSQPIRAFFRLQDGMAVVYRLEDASEPG